MATMRQPIDIPGFTLNVTYPSSLYSLERHEIIPYERFASDVFRDCVQELTERHLPPQVTVSFAPVKVDHPAWLINCRVRRERTDSDKFIIETPEFLPCLLAIFSHIVSPHFRTSSTASVSGDLKTSLQRFFDSGSAGARAYKSKGFASAVRTAYETANLGFFNLQDCIDDFDILAYLIANHEVAHIYIGQLTRKSPCSPDDRKAYEYLADLVAAEWMFRRYILLTPDDLDYRQHRQLPSHAHALASNSRWALAGVFSLLVLMAAAGVQKTGGRINLEGGLSHPGGFGRSWLQQEWILGAVEAHLKKVIGDDLWPTVFNFWEEASEKVFHSGLITRASMWQVVDNNETNLIKRAADIAEDMNVEELLPGLDFLRSRIVTAEEMRTKMK